MAIGFESKFQPIHTKHWRFDFHIVKLRLLIEIEGGPWSGGRGGKLSNKAWSLDRYDHAEEMGYKIERFHPDSILSGYVINWIKSERELKMEQIRPFPPTDFIDQAEEEEAIRLIPASDLKMGYCKLLNDWRTSSQPGS